MSRVVRRRRAPQYHPLRPLVAFLLVASFGILFVGCSGPETVDDEFVITDDDVERFRELTEEAEREILGLESGGTMTGTGGAASSVPTFSLPTSAGTSAETSAPASARPVVAGSAASMPTVDLSQVATYKGLRTVSAEESGNSYAINNEFLNIRTTPSATAPLAFRLDRGVPVDVTEFVDAAWAKIKTADGREGFASLQFLARPVSDDRLAAEEAKFNGMYFVNFRFVNVRKEANQKSEKLGEIPGQSIVRPISIEGPWAKVPFQGGEGFVSMQYLSPFRPRFVVRQDRYTLPILLYRLGQPGTLEAMEKHVARLKRDGMRFTTLRDFRDLLLSQQQRDVRLEPNTVIVAVTNVLPDNVRAVSDALNRSGVKATIFLESEHLGLRGITEKTVLTLVANGFDLQSATHTGDDLRALTNVQVELELKQSRKLLEEYAKRDVFAVAYPQGGVNDRVTQIAGDAGYLFGVSSAAERSFSREQLLKLPSILIFSTMTEDEVAKLAKGS